MDILTFAIGIPIIITIIGGLAGYFLATWIVLVLAVLAVIYGVYCLLDEVNPSSGFPVLAIGGAITWWMIVCVMVFLVSLLGTHYFVTDTTFIGDFFRNIKILR